VGSAGDRYELPDDSVYTLLRPAAESGGELVEWQFELAPGAVAPPPHRHQGQVEEYEVVEGELEVMLDGNWIRVGAGETIAVPIGSAHTFRAPGPGRVKALNRHRPALGFEEYLERLLKVVVDGGFSGPRSPKLLICLSLLWRQYPETLEATRAPERIGIVAMAGIGRLLGMERRLPPR
jgi:quercetin dioxygenase-like cupin family protein